MLAHLFYADYLKLVPPQCKYKPVMISQLNRVLAPALTLEPVASQRPLPEQLINILNLGDDIDPLDIFPADLPAVSLHSFIMGSKLLSELRGSERYLHTSLFPRPRSILIYLTGIIIIYTQIMCQ